MIDYAIKGENNPKTSLEIFSIRCTRTMNCIKVCNCMRYYLHIQLEVIHIDHEQGIQHWLVHYTHYLINPWALIKFDISILATLQQNTPK